MPGTDRLDLAPAEAVALPAAADVLALTKPGLTGMNLLVCLGAYALARGPADPDRLLALCVGTLLVVGGANALNQVLERDVDRHMARTAGRPLPAGRLDRTTATTFGVLAILAAAPLLWGVHRTVGALGLAAAIGYVGVYTPWKRIGPGALYVGAIVGAVPVLMGQAAATGTLPASVWPLFGVLVAWQIPHFGTIALYRDEDYARAGVRTLVAVRGRRRATLTVLLWSALLVPLALGPVLFGAASWGYGAVAALAGLAMIAGAARGLRPDAGRAWARRFFLASLAYLPVVTLALAIDVALT